MTLDFEAAVQRTYTTSPVPADLIPLSSSTSASNPTEQAPQRVLWIGCSDSSILETDCLNVPREEIFVVRNLGGIVSNGDTSSGSGVEWSLGVLGVEHIVICGHYCCSLTEQKTRSTALEGWYKDVTLLHAHHNAYLRSSHATLSEEGRSRHFEEVYVLAEVAWLKQQANVRKAIAERGVQVHAFVYDRESGKCVRLVEKEGESNGETSIGTV